MLFDKNGFYLVDDYAKDYDFAVSILDGSYSPKKSFKIYDAKEALAKGNLFPLLYSPYKSYSQVYPKVDGARANMLLDIQCLEFVINELNLYLDLNPNDVYAYKLFKDYSKEVKSKKENFLRTYGPLTLSECTDEWEWSKGVWPWEEGRM